MAEQFIRPQPVGEVSPEIELDISSAYFTAEPPPEFPPDPNVEIIITGVGTYQGLEVSGDYDFRSIVNITHTGVGTALRAEGTSAIVAAGGTSGLWVSGTSAIYASGNVSLGGGTVTVGRSNTDDVEVLGEFTSDLIPNTTSIHDLGSSSRRWADLFVVKTTTDSLLVDNNAYVGGATTLQNTLTVQQNSTFQKWIDVTGTIGASNVNVTGVVTATQFNGPATQIKTISDATNAARYVTFVDSNNGTSTGENLYTDAGITYNPSTNALTATTFVGNLQGNADTATSATSSGSATNADNVPVTSTADSTTWPMLVGATAGYQAPLYDTNLTYNASTNTLTAGNFSGNGSGLSNITASSATAASSFPVSSTGDSTTWPVLVGATSGNQTPLYDTGLTYNASSNTLSCTNFSGNASSANVSSQVGTVLTGTNATHYLTFVNSNNGSLTAENLYTDSGILYNPSSNILSTGTIIASGGFRSDGGSPVLITVSGTTLTFTVTGTGSASLTLA